VSWSVAHGRSPRASSRPWIGKPQGSGLVSELNLSLQRRHQRSVSPIEKETCAGAEYGLAVTA
jgi:hypothetical protein